MGFRAAVACAAVLVLALACGAAANLADPAVVAECSKRCEDVREESDAFFESMITACRQSMRFSPRPKTGNACKSGFDMDVAVEACKAGCTVSRSCAMRTEDAVHASFMAPFRKRLCQKYDHMLPRPRLSRACDTGLGGAIDFGCDRMPAFFSGAEDFVASQTFEMQAGASGSVVTDEDEMDAILAASSLDDIPPVPTSASSDSAAATEAAAAVAAEKAAAEKAAAEAAAAEKAAAEKAAAEKAAAEKAAAEKAAAEKAAAAEEAAAAEARRKAEEAHAAELAAEREAKAAAEAAEAAARKLAAAKEAEKQAEQAARAAEQAATHAGDGADGLDGI